MFDRLGALRLSLPVAMGACLIALLCLPGGPHAASSPVYTFPVPGSRVVSPQAQIAFRGAPVSQLRSIFVNGSRSGAHSGVVVADSDGHGGSFLPSTAFAPGETVTVSTNVNIAGAKNGMFQFTVARPAGGPPATHWPPAGRRAGDVWHFHSRPDLLPAAARTTIRGRTAPGDIFVAPQFGPLQDGPEILDSYGNVVWFKSLRGNDSAADLRVQRYRGRPVLTWWQGFVTGGNGVGEDVIYDSSYRQVATVSAANGLITDLHEFTITSNNTALISAVFPVHWDASSVGESTSKVVYDDVVQEIDIPTGLVLFQWDSLDHVPLTDTEAPLPTNPAVRLDYMHISSADLDKDGSVLISGRNTSALYKVDHRNGRVVWILGGRRSSFRMGRGASFAFQHDARVRSIHDWFVTMFDDGAGPRTVHSQSRGLKLFLDVKHMTASAAGQLEHSPPLLATYEGNYEQLPGGDEFIGWGSAPYFSEYNSNAGPVLDGRFVDGEPSYSAYRFPWNGQPDRRSHPPAVAASSQGRSTTVWASWNGATDVSSWRVLGGGSAGSLHTVASASKRGFETWITVGKQRYVAVEALDGSGRVLGRSRTVAAS